MCIRDSQYIGKANGMDDEIVVRVTMDGDKIADVEEMCIRDRPAPDRAAGKP